MIPTNSWHILAEFSLPSEPGNEIPAMETVVNAVRQLNLPNTILERLKTAVAESTMNAIEHGNKYREDLPVDYPGEVVPCCPFDPHNRPWRRKRYTRTGNPKPGSQAGRLAVATRVGLVLDKEYGG